MANDSTEPKLIAFDMDGTLITDRFIFRLARRFGFEEKLEEIISSCREEPSPSPKSI